MSYFYRNIHGIRTRFFHKGKGKKLIIIPGWRTDMERIYTLLEVLADYFEVYSFDLPGTGKTGFLKVKHTPNNYATFVSKLIKDLQIRDYILGGISMGTLVATLSLADDYVRKNTKVCFFIMPYFNARSLKLKRYAIGGIRIATSVFKRKPFYFVGDKIFKSDKMIKTAVRIVEREKALDKPKNLEHHIASFKRSSFKISMETIHETIKTDLNKISVTYTMPLYLFLSSHDPLINFEKTTEGYRRIFPNIFVEQLSTQYHAPRTVMTKTRLKTQLGHHFDTVRVRMKKTWHQP